MPELPEQPELPGLPEQPELPELPEQPELPNAARGAVLAVAGWSAVRPGGAFRLDVDRLVVRDGAAVGLLGASGSGKTTLLLGVLGLAPPAELACRGEVRFLGTPWPATGSDAWRARLGRDVSLCLQDARAALDPVAALGDQMRAATGAGSAECAAALAELGVDDAGPLLARFPHQVSGGQAQRVLLAIALLRRPRLLVLDEPSSGLDRPRVDDLLRGLALLRERTGTAVLVSSHDRYLLDGLAAEPFALDGGELTPGWPPQPAWPRRARAAPPGEVALEARGVTVRRGGKDLVAGADLEVRRGEVVALCGPSGAGKTTLARVLAGHLRPDRGVVRRPPGRTPVQMLFQDAYASLTPHLTLRRALAETAPPGLDLGREVLSLGLDPACLDRLPSALSGGERRRAALLRALSVTPEILVLDEPTASLDRATAVTVVENLLQTCARTEAGAVLITHDLELAEAVADRVLPMSGGRL